MPHFKHKIPTCTTLNELIEVLVGQIAFFKSMSLEHDSNYEALKKLSLDDFYERARQHFSPKCEFFDEVGMFNDIDDLEQYLHEFLKGFEMLDAIAVQQNVHKQLRLIQS